MKKYLLIGLFFGVGSVVAMETVKKYIPASLTSGQSREPSVKDYFWFAIELAKLDWCEDQLGYASQVVAEKYGIAEKTLVRKIKRRLNLCSDSDPVIQACIRSLSITGCAAATFCCCTECPCVAIPAAVPTILIGRKLYDMKQQGLIKKQR